MDSLPERCNYRRAFIFRSDIGPLPLSALAQLRQAGVLSDDTQVRAEDDTAWIPCRSVVTIGAPLSSGSSASAASPKSALGSRGGTATKFSLALLAFASLCFLLPFF